MSDAARIARAVEMILDAQTLSEDAAEAARDELKRVEAEIANLTGAIASGGDLPSLVAAVKQREALKAKHGKNVLRGTWQRRVTPNEPT